MGDGPGTTAGRRSIAGSWAARFNTCYNCLDRHIDRGRGRQLALVYDSPVTGTIRHFTYTELRDEVARVAGALAAQGVSAGDRVILYMPMVPEAVFAMLACAHGSAPSIRSSSAAFAPNELAKRIDDAKPTLILSASCGIEANRIVSLQAAARRGHRAGVAQAGAHHYPAAPAGGGGDDRAGVISTGTRRCDGAEPADCVPVASTDPLYILYTSGTTGDAERRVVRDNGGHAVALNWSMEHVYGVGAGEVYWAGSDIGWVVGHSYIVYGPLLRGATTILYEGKPVGTPDPGAFWRVISQHGVNVFFTAPTAFRAIKKEDPDGERFMQQYDLSRFRTLFLAGERCDPDTLIWARDRLGVPVIDHWWQTETGLGDRRQLRRPRHAAGEAGIADARRARLRRPRSRRGGSGDAGGTRSACNRAEAAAPARLPSDALEQRRRLPAVVPVALPRLLPDRRRRLTGTMTDYLYIMSRVDDIINVAGHRLSTGGMEEVLAYHPDVAECAVVGVADDHEGRDPDRLRRHQGGRHPKEEDATRPGAGGTGPRKRSGRSLRSRLAAIVPRLPKTRSGKILRGTVKKIADGQPYKVPATIDDPAILDEITEALLGLGYPKADS